MLNSDISKITSEDIKRLIELNTQENQSLEYKEKLWNLDGDNKWEFLYDVTSFINTNDAYIVIGIREEKDSSSDTKKYSIKGIDEEITDDLIMRMQSILMDNVEPKPPNNSMLFSSTIIIDDKKIVVIKITRSWINPHFVRKGKHYACYIRNSNQKIALDINQIKDEILMKNKIMDDIHDFINNRISNVKDNYPDIKVDETKPYCFFHIVPLASFSKTDKYDFLSEVEITKFKSGSFVFKRFNFYGADLFTSTNKAKVQLFRTSCLEVFMNDISHISDIEGKPHNFLRVHEIENALINHLQIMTCEFSNYIKGPLMISLFIDKSCGYIIPSRDYYYSRDSLIHDKYLKSEFMITEEEIQDIFSNPRESSQKIAKLFKYTFDLLYQASGYNSCIDFDKNGNFVLRGY